MVAQGDAEHLLGLVLLDDEAVEEGLDLAGSLIKEELVLGRGGRGGFGSAGGFGFGHGAAGQVLAHEFLQLALEFLRGGRTVANVVLHHW